MKDNQKKNMKLLDFFRNKKLRNYIRKTIIKSYLPHDDVVSILSKSKNCRRDSKLIIKLSRDGLTKVDIETVIKVLYDNF
jgi:hypothetical protein